LRKQNGVRTARIQISVDATTDQILERMIPVGIHGKTKAEVASWILREWIWHNQGDLARVGVQIRSASRSSKARSKRKT
jgi:hypothetical protein